MCGSMADIQSAAAEIRRGKKEERRRRRKKSQGKNIMVCPITYGDHRNRHLHTNGWTLLASLGHPCRFQRVSHLGSVTVRHSSSGRQPNFAALNRGRHLYSAGRPLRWALAHISSLSSIFTARRKSIRPVKIELEWGAGVVICLKQGANDLHMVQLMTLPHLLH